MGRIAHPAVPAIEEYRAHSEPSKRLDSALLAFEMLVRTDALVLTAAVNAASGRDDKIRGLMDKPRFSLGDWHALLQAAAARLPRSMFPDLQTWVKAMEQRCDRRLGAICREGPFQTMLAIRNWRSHHESRLEMSQVAARNPIADCCLERLLDAHPELGGFAVQDSEKLRYESHDGSADCGVLLLNGALANRPEEVLLFRCRRGSALEYATTSGSEYQSSKMALEIEGYEVRGVAPLETIKATVSPHVLHARLREHTQHSVDRYSRLQIYRPERMVRQLDVEAVVKTFLEGNERCLIVDGPIGSGKTSWLCGLAEERLAGGRVVLLVSGDRLVGSTFPDNLAALLRVSGQFSSALERLRGVSADGRIVVLVDNVDSGGRGDVALQSLIMWAECVGIEGMKVIPTLRSDRVLECGGALDQAFSPELGRRFRLPPFATPQLVDLAERLSSASEYSDPAILERRRNVAVRLGEFADDSARRPGLAGLILENADLRPDSELFTAAEVYRDLFERVILQVDRQGRALTPRRGVLLRRFAAALMESGTAALPLDDPRAGGITLMDESSEHRSIEYEALLSLQVLAETMEDLRPIVSFATPSFGEYVAALGLPLDARMSGTLARLCGQGQSWPPALTTAAFLVARATSRIGAKRAWEAVALLPEPKDRLLRQLAVLDGRSWLLLFPHFVRSRESGGAEMVAWLLECGECRLAAHAGEVLATCVSDQDAIDKAWYLVARAHYEIDDYAKALEELARISKREIHAVSVLQGDIALSQNDWEGAVEYFRLALDSDDGANPASIGHAMAGRGYALGHMKRGKEAEALLRMAIAKLEPLGGSRSLAEAWSDLGETLVSMSREEEARGCFESSLRINQRLGSLVGIGIVEGLLGDLALRANRISEAKLRLSTALQMADRAGNRWRQAWSLARLAEVARALDEPVQAERLDRTAASIVRAIQTDPQDTGAG